MGPLPERIICAANMYEGRIILGARHNDEFMQQALEVLSITFSPQEAQHIRKKYFALEAQGFLTNRRRWVSREEAFQIASQQQQVVRKTGGMNSKELFSEDLY